MVCQSWSAKAEGTCLIHVLMGWPQHITRSWSFLCQRTCLWAAGLPHPWLLVWDFGMPGNLGQMGKVLTYHKDGRFGRRNGTHRGWASLPRTKLPLMSWLRITQAFFTAGSSEDKQPSAHVKMTLANLSICVPLPPNIDRQRQTSSLGCALRKAKSKGKGVLKCYTTLFATVRLAVICYLLLGKG